MLPLLIFSIAVVDVRAQQATIGVEPDSIFDPGLGPGSTFTVDIWVRGVADLAGVEFYLGYNTTVLTATLIEYGDIFGPTYFPLWSAIKDAEGYLQYSLAEQFGEPGFTGDGRVAIITFSVDSLGASTLNLHKTKLSDSSLPPMITFPKELDGLFSNEAFHDIAVTDVIAYPTEVDAGDIVTINVTITNQGDYNETFTVTVYADIIAYNYTWDAVIGLVDLWVDVGDEITVGTQTVTDLAPGANTTSTLTWNTTGVEAANYTISAQASTVPDEIDTADNLFVPPRLDRPRTWPSPPPYPPSPDYPSNAYSPTSVTVTAIPAHDIAITSVVPSPTEVDAGDIVTINVAITNQGDYNETFSVTVYYDDVSIDTEPGISLENGTSRTLTFTWNTADVAKGTYTIKAEASVVTGETDTDDNTYDAGTVKVREAAPAPNMLIFVAVAAVVVIIAAVIYIVKIRK